MTRARLKQILSEYPGQLYQTYTWEGAELNEGITCSARRRSLIDLDDIEGKHVLDLGCATGAECVWAWERGAASVFGVDKGTEQIATFRKVLSVIDPCGFRSAGLQHDLTETSPALKEYQTVFCFAILQHVGYRKVYDDVPGAEVVYVESGVDSNFTVDSFDSDKWRASFLGYTPRNRVDERRERMLFRLTRRCRHTWVATEHYSTRTSKVACFRCQKSAYAKPSTPLIYPRAATEHICRRLAKMLSDRGVQGVCLPKTELAYAAPSGHSAKSPWDHSCVIVEDLNQTWGEQARVTSATQIQTKGWPAWLYWFDKWIGRADARGDGNLLYFEDHDRVIPVDFELAFPWLNAKPVIHPSQPLPAARVPEIDDSVKGAIESFTSEEIWDAVFCNLPEDFASNLTLAAIWAGLCLRAKKLDQL